MSSKHDYIYLSAQMKKELKVLEKDKYRTFYTTRLDMKTEISALEEYERSLGVNRGMAAKGQKEQLQRIKGHVGALHATVEEFSERQKTQGTQQDYDKFLTNLQKTTDCIDHEIGQFKKQSKAEYDLLLHEERSLANEIDSLVARFDSWENQKAIPAAKVKTFERVQRAVTNPNQVEISGVEKEIADLGGPTLGWDPADHQDFLRIRTAHKGKLTQGFFQEAFSLIPNQDRESITLHVNKYNNYLQLVEKKKGILSKWKEDKAAELRKFNELSASPKKPVAKPKPNPVTSEETKARIAEWKQAKLEKEQEMKNKTDQEKRQTVRAQSARRRDDQVMKKQRIAEYKERKEIDQHHKQLVDQYQKRKAVRPLTAEDKHRIKLREDKLASQKAASTQAKIEKENSKKQSAYQAKLKQQAAFAYVGSRLDQTTAATENRKADETSSGGNTRNWTLSHTSGRAIPTWRQGINS